MAISAGVKADWEEGDLVFRSKADGTEVFRIGASGVTVAGAYELPTADGTEGQVLSTDGSGAVSWADDATS